MISLIYSLKKDNNQVIVEAVIEDMVLVREQTKYEPEEYGPALCRASFELEEDEELPENDDELIDYLDDRYLEWQILSEEEI